MGRAVRITSLNPKFNGSHFGLPPSSIHRMTGWVAISRVLWRMRTAPIVGENERSKGEGKGKEEGRKGEREIGSEALAETEKNCQTLRPGNEPGTPENAADALPLSERQVTLPASLFEILSALPPLQNIGIIQCPQLTNPLRPGPVTSPMCFAHGQKE